MHYSRRQSLIRARNIKSRYEDICCSSWCCHQPIYGAGISRYRSSGSSSIHLFFAIHGPGLYTMVFQVTDLGEDLEVLPHCLVPVYCCDIIFSSRSVALVYISWHFKLQIWGRISKVLPHCLIYCNHPVAAWSISSLHSVMLVYTQWYFKMYSSCTREFTHRSVAKLFGYFLPPLHLIQAGNNEVLFCRVATIYFIVKTINS